MHANHAVVMQLTYPRTTLAPDTAPGHSTIPPPLESPFLQRLDPVTVQPSLNGTDVGRWDSAEESPGKGAAGHQGSQELGAKAPGQAAEDTKCVMLCFQFHLLHSWCAMLSCAVSCCAMQYHALLCCDTLCRIMLCCAVSCYATLCCAMLCHAMLDYALSCYAMPCHGKKSYAMLRCTMYDMLPGMNGHGI
jgi:hypothetical protein